MRQNNVTITLSILRLFLAFLVDVAGTMCRRKRPFGCTAEAAVHHDSIRGK